MSVSQARACAIERELIGEKTHIVDTTIVGIKRNGTTSKMRRVVNQAVGLRRVGTVSHEISVNEVRRR